MFFSDHKEYFTANADGNQVSLVVNTPLPIEVLVKKQIFLIVRADREYTTGDSATIVIHLPEGTYLLIHTQFILSAHLLLIIIIYNQFMTT